ncbi:NAD(P)H-hydrate dehydratase [Caldibacillus lycopersici]|uniref:Bifunctional NAD(P)H-hydrate repair enzyme n=1 Tax=Perspicuibacillus lycopersici TaxID=1325689 RepID=A0AAE3ISC9_9BACI|nr:NAD(P)H-hydrate dehydratase [Perspicuibacillus lycopersici]MCU9613591.1 NAD(P)H-hydrate dehydratase [Perspicuibacillus lycopersici]
MYVYQEEEIHQLDKIAASNGLSTNALMETSGRSLYFELTRLVSIRQSILILAGKGNNGGDAIVLARYLLQNGYQTELVFPMGLPKSEVAKEHFRYYQSLGFPYLEEIPKKQTYDVIIDGLLGVGTKLPLNDTMMKIVSWCNNQPSLRIAIDLPTGVVANFGEVETAFQADYTFSLHGYKPSAFLLPASAFYGKSKVLDIGLPHPSQWKIWSEADFTNTWKTRNKDAHKGTFGTGLLLAGSDEMPGSALLAGLASMKIGIGKLIIGTTPFVASIIASRLPEATYWFNGLNKLPNGDWPVGVKGIAIGPGLTDTLLVEEAIKKIWETNIPVILDAGALQKREYPKRNAPTIITPHPGEFSRITGLTTAEIQKNRLKLASDYAQEHQVIVVLKGANTVIAFPDGSGVINITGNPALAKGGSGDTLAGMILALLCMGENPKIAVANAVYLHGLCADELVKTRNENTIVASELSNILGELIYTLTHNIS